MKTALLMSILITLSVGLYAASDYSSYDHAIGAKAGPLSTSGLSYHVRLDAQNAIEVTGGVYLNYGTLSYGLGLEYQRTFGTSSYSDWFDAQLYWFAGASHTGYASWNGSSPQYYTPKFGLGGGFGVELIAFDHFSVPVEFGYFAEYNPNSSWAYNKFGLSFLAQIGARYRY